MKKAPRYPNVKSKKELKKYEDDIKIRETFFVLQENESLLTYGQIGFVRALKTYFKKNKKLTSKQEKCLFELSNSIHN